MSKPSDPVEDFKRAVTATVRAIACDKEMTVSFGADALSGGGHTNTMGLLAPDPTFESAFKWAKVGIDAL